MHGTARDDVRPGLRISGFERRVTIAFSVAGIEVVILRLLYGGQNWTDFLTEADE
jgi:toxin ParE1/3/4